MRYNHRFLRTGMPGAAGELEDTREFPVKPSPALAMSMREGMRAPRRNLGAFAERIVPVFGMQLEETKEIVLTDGKGTRRSLSKTEQLAEMVRIIFVLNRLEGKISEFLPGCGSDASAMLEECLREAARRASLVAEGRSPKQEFLSQVPTSLMPPVLGVYGRAEAMYV